MSPGRPLTPFWLWLSQLQQEPADVDPLSDPQKWRQTATAIRRVTVSHELVPIVRLVAGFCDAVGDTIENLQPPTQGA